MATMYVAKFGEEWESFEVIGVYTTLQKAQTSLCRFAENSNIRYTPAAIQQMKLDFAGELTKELKVGDIWYIVDEFVVDTHIL